MTLIASKIPRGKCPVCERDYALRRSGRVRQHMTAPGVLCMIAEYYAALDRAKAAWQDGEPPPEITAMAKVSGLDPGKLWDHVEGGRGWEPHDTGYEDAVRESARQMTGEVAP